MTEGEEQQQQQEVKKTLTQKERKAQRTPSKLYTACSAEHAAALKCGTEDFATKEERCAPFFASYKACRTEEHRLKLLANGGGVDNSMNCTIS
jgi:hypothetical protein